jgi:hypothetical protein
MSDTSDLDKYHPVTIDGKPIKYNDNPATLAGVIHAVLMYLKRTGMFELLFTHNAVLLPSSGKTAVDSLDAAAFITGEKSHADTDHSYEKPAPNTAARVAKFNAAQATDATKIKTRTANFGPTDPFILQPQLVKLDHKLLFRVWQNVLGAAETTRDALEANQGEGMQLLAALEALYASAEPADKALLSIEFDGMISAGITGEMNLDNFREFTTDYEDGKINLHPAEHPSGPKELMMINTMAHRDAGIREAYELRASVKPPTNYSEAKAMIRTILRSRLTSNKIDQAKSGAPRQAALAVAAAAAPGSTESDSDRNMRILMERNSDLSDKLAAAVEQMAMDRGRRPQCTRRTVVRASRQRPSPQRAVALADAQPLRRSGQANENAGQDRRARAGRYRAERRTRRARDAHGAHGRRALPPRAGWFSGNPLQSPGDLGSRSQSRCPRARLRSSRCRKPPKTSSIFGNSWLVSAPRSATPRRCQPTARALATCPTTPSTTTE